MDWFHSEFAKEVPKGKLSRKEFSEILAKNSDFVKNLFSILDNDHSNFLSIQEFMGAVNKLTSNYGTQNKKTLAKTLLGQLMLNTASSGNLDIKGFTSICKDKKFAECLFGLFDNNENGKLEVRELIMCLDKIASAQDTWYDYVENWFKSVASENGCIDKEDFLKHLNLTKSFWGERLFAVADKDKSGSVDVNEMMAIIHILTHGTTTERIRLLFDMFDVDGNKKLSRDEMISVIKSCLVDSQIKKQVGLAEMLADFLFKTVDTDSSGDVTFEEFEEFLRKYPHIADNLTISLPGSLQQNKPKQKSTPRSVSWTTIVMHNKPLIVYWLIYITVNVVLFVTGAEKYMNNSNALVVIARGAGRCLNFNAAYIVVMMYRHFWSFVRSTCLRRFLPLDQTIDIHKVTGYVILFFSLLHIAMHVGNCAVLSNETNVAMPMYLFTLNKGVGWVGGSASITGWILIFILVIIVLLTLPCIRGRGYFQLFYWSHWLFLTWWVVLIIHAADFWKWLVGPAALYTFEKLYQQFKKTHSARILSMKCVSPKVSQLLIERPEAFKFKAGDYIFIKIREVAQTEWHPFTISSAPEQTDYISLHIQASGDWTKRLHAIGQHWRNEPMELMLRGNGVFNSEKRGSVFFNNERRESVVLKHVSPFKKLDHSLRNERNQQQMTQTQRDVESNENTQSVLETEVMGCTMNMLPLYDSRIGGADISATANNQPPVRRKPSYRVDIDGPYGSPSSSLQSIEHAILIGAGIGVTPFSSILQSIQLKAETWQGCESSLLPWSYQSYDVTHISKKVDFIWVTRTLDSMDWFLMLLKELEESQSKLEPEERFLDITLHATSALAMSDIRAVVLQMALQLCYEEDGKDPLSGLKTRIQPGRPNWKKLFQNIISKSKWDITVLYCGPPRLEKTLKELCREFKLNFRSENF